MNNINKINNNCLICCLKPVKVCIEGHKYVTAIRISTLYYYNYI